MGNSTRPCRSLLALLTWIGLAAASSSGVVSTVRAAEDGPDFGPCDSSLFEPCPHCAEACEEMDSSVTSPYLSEAPSSPPTGLQPDPTLAFTEQTGALGRSSFAEMQSVSGYIDDAVIRSRVRIRYDYAKNASFPDRAEYLYPAPGAVGGRGPGFLGGPGIGGLDFQEIRTYTEWAWSPSFSLLAEFPVRFVNADADGSAFTDPLSDEPTDSVAGAGDITAGLRIGLLTSPEQCLTAQFKVYTPTADPRNGLGTGHTSLETGLLYQRRCRDRWTVFGEVQDWVAISASRIEREPPIVTPPPDYFDFDGQLFSGNVLRYGIGVGYDIWSTGAARYDDRLTAVLEVVGWSVLDGFKTDANLDILDAEGDTIVNGKFGLRYNLRRNTVYLGYGTAWTSERWYSDIFRLEMGHYF